MSIPEEQDGANGWRKKKTTSFFFFSFCRFSSPLVFFLKPGSHSWRKIQCVISGSVGPGVSCEGCSNPLFLARQGATAGRMLWAWIPVKDQKPLNLHGEGQFWTLRHKGHASHIITKGWHFGSISLFKGHFLKNKKDENQHISCSQWGAHSIQLRFNMLHLWNNRPQNMTEISQGPYLKYRWVLYLQIESPWLPLGGKQHLDFKNVILSRNTGHTLGRPMVSECPTVAQHNFKQTNR